MAPADLMPAFNEGSRARSSIWSAAKKMRSAAPAPSEARTGPVRASICERKFTSRTPNTRTDMPALTPSLSRRPRGLRIFSAHSAALGPSSNTATSPSKPMANSPPSARSDTTDAKGMLKRKSPRKRISEVSRSALPSDVCPLKRALQTASEPISGLQQLGLVCIGVVRLVIKQPALDIKAAAEAVKLPVRANDAVTRDDHSNRVGSTGAARRAIGAWPAGFRCKFSVGDGCGIRDGCHAPPDCTPEFAALADVERQVERTALAFEVLLELTLD